MINCPKPPSINDEHDIVVTGLFWIPSENMLVISYLNHGIWFDDFSSCSNSSHLQPVNDLGALPLVQNGNVIHSGQ